MHISLAISPCPNDTFIFDALVNHKIDTKGLQFNVQLEDVETLNNWALQQKHQVSKISYGVLPYVLSNYKVLPSGGALGKGVGPLLVTASAQMLAPNANTLIALPGKNTTANILFSLAYPQANNKIFMPFHEIENWVINTPNSCGVIIHENRFTYAQKGLYKIQDLGMYWEQTTQLPIPLGGIIVHHSVPKETAVLLNQLIQQSVQYAWQHYPTLGKFVIAHAQEMEEEVMRSHINLYVNHYSEALGTDGVNAVKYLLQHTTGNTYNDQDIFITQ